MKSFRDCSLACRSKVGYGGRKPCERREFWRISRAIRLALSGWRGCNVGSLTTFRGRAWRDEGNGLMGGRQIQRWFCISALVAGQLLAPSVGGASVCASLACCSPAAGQACCGCCRPKQQAPARNCCAARRAAEQPQQGIAKRCRCQKPQPAPAAPSVPARLSTQATEWLAFSSAGSTWCSSAIACGTHSVCGPDFLHPPRSIPARVLFCVWRD